MYFKDLDKLNLIWWFDFRLKPIFAFALATSKNITYFVSGEKLPKNNHLASLTKFESLIHTVPCIPMNLSRSTLTNFEANIIF